MDFLLVIAVLSLGFCFFNMIRVALEGWHRGPEGIELVMGFIGAACLGIFFGLL